MNMARKAVSGQRPARHNLAPAVEGCLAHSICIESSLLISTGPARPSTEQSFAGGDWPLSKAVVPGVALITPPVISRQIVPRATAAPAVPRCAVRAA